MSRPCAADLLRQLALWWRQGGLSHGLPEPQAGRFRARMLRSLVRLAPLTMATILANVVLILVSFRDSPALGWLIVWAVPMAGLALMTLAGWWRHRLRPPREVASERALRQATLRAGLLGAAWSLIPALAFPIADAQSQYLVVGLIPGMIGAGGFALATVPVAGTVYVVALTGGAAIALWRSDLALAIEMSTLLLLFATIVLASLWSTARMFRDHVLAEFEAERQKDVVGLLLRDFEENASDVLWEVAPAGQLRHGSPRLVELLGLLPQELHTLPILTALRRRVPADPDAKAEAKALLKALAATLEQAVPFRDVVIAAEQDGRVQWWSLSAKPLVGASGQPDGWRGVARDVTAARNSSRRLSWLAHNDTLTGLANRHQFLSRLRELLARPAGAAPKLAVMCLDLDHFKAVNDTLGHAVGDGLLKVVSQRLLAGTRRGDLVARLGGDEFALIVQADTGAEVEALAQRLVAAVREPCEIQGLIVNTRASIGIAMAPTDGHDADTLINHADLALYAAKAAGRDGASVFRPEMAQSTRRRTALEEALRQALARRELRLVFQPQVEAQSWKVLGFEALLRWQHPELGAVPPNEFIPVAEACGLMPQIGQWVLEEACRQASRWPAEVAVSVNVSPAQAVSEAFAAEVERTLVRCRLAPHRLELEITESMLLDETQNTADGLLALRSLSVQIALDDFGTGYSALAYLRRYPLNTLKIDRSFVAEITQRPDARAIVRMILGLAQTLNMRTVAEGVEEWPQAAALLADGCTSLQGWLLGRPLEAEQVLPFLAEWSARPRPEAERLLAPAEVPLVLA